VKADGSNREVRDGTLTVRVSADGPSRIVAVLGELDMANTATLSVELQRAEDEDPATVTVDMTELEFIDSTGIAVLVAAHRRLNRGGKERLRLVRSRSTGVQRVMAVTGLDRALPFVAADPGPPAQPETAQ
jgi:anti-sigma B factor antagonist